MDNNGQPAFVPDFLTYDQFNWIEYASFAMAGNTMSFDLERAIRM